MYKGKKENRRPNNFDKLYIKVNVDTSEISKELDNIIKTLSCITDKLSISFVCDK